MSVNALTVDLEDWYHVCALEREVTVPRSGWRVRPATERILALLAEFGVRATFFVLGNIAAAEPELISMIAAEGHEIASHGWSHRLLHQLTPAEFRDELARTEDVVAGLTGSRPVGFRAPQWSVSRRTPWAHDILVERGYLYDSSLNPLAFIGDRRGPRTPFTVAAGGGALREFPPLVTPTCAGNLPTGGGWGFRMFPETLVWRTVRRLNGEGHPAVFYLHPREADPDGPRLDLPPLARFAAYGTRRDALPRVRMLLEKFRFATLRELAAHDVLRGDPGV